MNHKLLQYSTTKYAENLILIIIFQRKKKYILQKEKNTFNILISVKLININFHLVEFFIFREFTDFFQTINQVYYKAFIKI